MGNNLVDGQPFRLSFFCVRYTETANNFTLIILNFNSRGIRVVKLEDGARDIFAQVLLQNKFYFTFFNIILFYV